MTTPKEETLQWFKDAKLGMFVHWGMYSVLARGEQILARDLMPLSEYMPYAEQFRPAADWAPTLARRAKQGGAKYMVLTTRHHDGYCLFDTVTDEFTAVKTGPGRDLVAEYVQACRDEGLGVGLYYSVGNYRHPAQWDPEHHASELNGMVEELHTQLTELMSNYGKIDLLWYDGGAAPGRGMPGVMHYCCRGLRPSQDCAAFFRIQEINAKVRALQPGILINDRAGVKEDFGTPEQHVRSVEGRPWEACMTVNFPPGWAYLRHAVANKTAGQVLHQFITAVRLGGNFLFNVGPKADGYLDDREEEIFEQLGRWLEVHGEAVYGAKRPAMYDFEEHHAPCSHYGMFTQKDKTLYLTLFFYPGETLVLNRIRQAPRSATLLTTGQSLRITPRSNHRFEISGLPSEPPEALAAVIKLEYDEPPTPILFHDASWLEGEFSPEDA